MHTEDENAIATIVDNHSVDKSGCQNVAYVGQLRVAYRLRRGGVGISVLDKAILLSFTDGELACVQVLHREQSYVMSTRIVDVYLT